MIITNITIEDDSAEIISKNDELKDLALGLASANIEARMKTSGLTPYDKGGLRSSIRSYKSGSDTYTVMAGVEYAAYQEAGMRADGSHIVQNYTTSGTGSGFFTEAVETITSRFMDYIETAKRAVGL